jgi:hypothetical protein
VWRVTHICSTQLFFYFRFCDIETHICSVFVRRGSVVNTVSEYSARVSSMNCYVERMLAHPNQAHHAQHAVANDSPYAANWHDICSTQKKAASHYTSSLAALH